MYFHLLYPQHPKSLLLIDFSEECQKPQPPLLLKKYCNTSSLYLQYASNCIAVLLPYVSRYASHLYRTTPPIYIARIWGKYWWLGSPLTHQDVPIVPWSHKPMSLSGRLGNSEIGGCKEIRQPFANPSPTPRQPLANPSPTFRQPFANLFCQPLSNPLFPWTPGTRLETRVNGFLVVDLFISVFGPLRTS